MPGVPTPTVQAPPTWPAIRTFTQVNATRYESGLTDAIKDDAAARAFTARATK
jgi:hypothetical protein